MTRPPLDQAATTRRRLNRSLLAGTATALGLATALAPLALTVPADAAPTFHRRPAAAPVKAVPRSTPVQMSTVAAARKAGIGRGQAYMGWYAKATGAGEATASVRVPTVGPAAVTSAAAASTVAGMDVSSWQGNVAWAHHFAAGRRFAYVKASEGRGYTNPYFRGQYTGSYTAGLVRGAYHFALPNSIGGARQARYFVAHGGGWSADGRTLPGVLDIEYNPYGQVCYNRTPAQLVRWTGRFVREYKRLTGRDAVIYTTTEWWQRCMGNSRAFSSTNPLWIARYAASPGKLPGGWTFYTFWQYTSSPYDKNRFSANLPQLRRLARG